jgi:aminoglycoside phosphotransferase
MTGDERPVRLPEREPGVTSGNDLQLQQWSGGHAVAKRFTDPEKFRNEVASLRLLRSTEVVVPRLLRVSDMLVVTEYVSTVDTFDIDSARLREALADVLNRLYAVSVRGVGPAGSVGVDSRRGFTSVEMWIQSKVARYQEQLERLGIREPLGTALDNLQRTPVPDQLALIHLDLKPDNLLVTRDGVCLIDWECSAYGDPVSDIARLSVRFHIPLSDERLSDLIDRLGVQIDQTSLDYYRRLHLVSNIVLGWDSTDQACHRDARDAYSELT